MTKIDIVDRDQKVLLQVDVNDKTTVEDLKNEIQLKLKIVKNRQRLVVNKSVLENTAKVIDHASSKITLKDLGLQINWKTVFLIEYLGPIIIHSIFYLSPSLFYSTFKSHSQNQTIALVIVLLHYLKRELETIFIHRFSNDTMPIKNLPKNCKSITFCHQ